MSKAWRLFRPDTGHRRWPEALAYLGLYVLCLGLSLWNAANFDVVLLWFANGVLLAALLQLPRRWGLPVLILCWLLNLVTSMIMAKGHIAGLTDPVLDLCQVIIAAVLTHRLCGAQLDMRQPIRMMAFGLGAALPAVVLTTLFNVGVVASSGHHGLITQAFMWRHLFLMEYLGLVTMTPCLLLIGQTRRDAVLWRKVPEGMAHLGILTLVVLGVFLSRQSALFAIFIPMMIMAYRMSPAWLGTGVILVALVGGIMTLQGHGPVSRGSYAAAPELFWAPALMHQAPVYYALCLSVTLIALPISALITDRRRLMQRLSRHNRTAQAQSRLVQDALEAKTRFLAMVSHEMKTPLNSINGFSQLLKERADLPADARHQIEAVAESGEALLVLIDDLIEASGGSQGAHMAPMDLDLLVNQTLGPDSLAAVAKGLGVRLDLEALKGVTALCDARRIRAALRQLMSNAVKFSDQGLIEVRARLQDDRLILTISDQGRGIDPAYLPRLFEPLTQGDDTQSRHHGGAGIGLAAARRHARVMDGDVVLISTGSSGTVFELTARIEPLGLPRPVTVPDQADAGAQPRSILIVDDIALNRSVLRIMVEVAGYQVDEASDGATAVRMAASTAYDIILMDLRMPGMDGYEASRLIRQQTPQGRAPAILAITADAGSDVGERLQAAGMDGHLHKPFTRDSLIACLDLAIRQKGPSGLPDGRQALVET